MEPIAYPASRRGTTVDHYFGIEVPDPYRWLEDDRSDETSAWVDAQNEVTQAFLADNPYRADYAASLTEKLNVGTVTELERAGDFLYYRRLSPGASQPLMMRQPLAGGDEELFLDVNDWSEDGTTALSYVFFSENHRYAACCLSDGGSDWSRVVVIDTQTRKVVDEQVNRVKSSPLFWKGDEGFYYSTYDPVDASHLSARNDQHKVYFHRFSSELSDDALIFGDAEDPVFRIAHAQVSDDQRWLYIIAANDTNSNRLFVRPLNTMDAPWQEITVSGEYACYCIGNTDTHHLLLTDYEAPMRRVVSVPVESPSLNHLSDVVPEQAISLQDIRRVGQSLFLVHGRDALCEVTQTTLEGQLIRTVELPGNGAVALADGLENDTQAFISCAGLSQPMVHVELDLATGESRTRIPAELPFEASDYETHSLFYTSKDGTRVPVFITHRKGLTYDGTAPTILYGYGGFGITVPPVINANIAAWLEQGGVWVQANIRGGDEYGKVWHDAGTKLNKQNVFDDFIAAAEFLIEKQVCSSSTLAIEGGSNGGLLVGACMTQRPELFAAALPGVGVLDMLRYQEFTIGAAWAYDYGLSTDSEEMFQGLLAYSPLHNVREGVRYPWTLVTTGDHDDRVVPAHSFKFAAELQAKASEETPQLIRIQRNAGHGAGKSKQAMIDENADVFAFARMAFDAQQR